MWPWGKDQSKDEEQLKKELDKAYLEMIKQEKIAQQMSADKAQSHNLEDAEEKQADSKGDEAKQKRKLSKLENMEKQAIQDMHGDDYAKAMAGMMMAIACRYRMKKLKGEPASLLGEAATMIAECTPSSPGSENAASKLTKGIVHTTGLPIKVLNGLGTAATSALKAANTERKKWTTPSHKPADGRNLAKAKEKFTEAKAALDAHRKEHNKPAPNPPGGTPRP